MSKEKIIEQYIEMFGELPPADAVISYYDGFYIDLMEKAIKSEEKITGEILEKAIGNNPYDYSLKRFNNFKKGK